MFEVFKKKIYCFCLFLFGWRPSAEKTTAQPHLTARLPQVAQKPPRQRHLAAQEKQKRSKNKSSRTKKQNPRHKQAYCTCLCGIMQLQAREPRKRDEAVPATPKPKRRQNKQKATTQPSDTGPLGTRWRQAARKLRTTQCAIDAGVVRTVGMDSFLAWARVSPPAS